jgi:hypothetical protein
VRGFFIGSWVAGFISAILFGGLIQLFGWEPEEDPPVPVQTHFDPSCHDLIGRLADEAIASYDYGLGINERGSVIDDDGMRLMESRLREICING